MRAKPTSTVCVKPKAAGMTWNTNSAATPTVVQSHMTALATVPYMARGTGFPGLSFFQADMATSIRMHQTQDAATTSTRPT